MENNVYTITGATGYIGQMFLKLILETEPDAKVYVIVRESSKLIPLFNNDRVNVIIYSNENDLIEPIKESNYLVHLAALYTKKDDSNSIDELISSNINLSSHIFNVANKYNKDISIVSASTFSSLNLFSELAPQTFYAATKSCVEVIAKYYKDLSIKFLTFPDTYGPYDHRPKIHNILMNNTKWPFTFNSNRNQEMYMMCVFDIIGNIISALEVDKKGINIYDIFMQADLITLEQLTEFLGVKDKCIFNDKAEVIRVPKIDRGNSKILYKSRYNICKIKSILERR